MPPPGENPLNFDSRASRDIEWRLSRRSGTPGEPFCIGLHNLKQALPNNCLDCDLTHYPLPATRGTNAIGS